MTRSAPFFLFGAWLSFVGTTLALASMLPVTSDRQMKGISSMLGAIAAQDVLPVDTIPLEGRVISIDMRDKELFLYDDGRRVRRFPVVAVATEGVGEVPSGSYTVGGLEPRHMSRTSGAWATFAVSFGENYAIQGGDEEDDGSVVLDERDAKDVYDFARTGMKVIVARGASRGDFAPSRHLLIGKGKPPLIAAESFVVADVDTGEVLWSRKADERLRPGRIATFATALTAIENLDQYKNVRMGELLLPGRAADRRPPSRDDELPLGALLYPLLFDANETAARALEEELDRAGVASYVNERARAIGMDSTEFSNGNVLTMSTSSASDLLALLTHIATRQPFLLAISRDDEHAIYAEDGEVRYRWVNKNPWVLSRDDGYLGGLGAIEQGASGSGMFLFSLRLSEFSHRRIAFIIANSEDLVEDVARMRAFVERSYRYGSLRIGDTGVANAHSIAERIGSFFLSDIDYDRGL